MFVEASEYYSLTAPFDELKQVFAFRSSVTLLCSWQLFLSDPRLAYSNVKSCSLQHFVALLVVTSLRHSFVKLNLPSQRPYAELVCDEVAFD